MIKLGSRLEILKTANKATALLPNGKISKVASMEDNSEYSNDFVYFIARALTANVPNANGDYFPTDELKKSYESFIGKNLHLNHDADDVSKAVGKIIDAWFIENDNDTYVVCLCKIDRKLHPELARNVETGVIDSVSMGCSCQECECSVCGKVAHNENEMCEHLKNFLGREIEINGEKKLVSSINRGITFNELSLVGDPADCNAHMYQIYASKGNNMKKVALQNDVTEERLQDAIKPELEKAEDAKIEETEKLEEPVTKEEVKEEIKETEEKLEEVKEIVEEKVEEVKDIKEEVKDIKEEVVEEKVEKEESCNKKAETEDEVKEEKVEEAVEEKVEEVKEVVDDKVEEIVEDVKEVVEEKIEEVKEEITEEKKEEEPVIEEKETVEEIKKEEDIDKKAEEEVKDIEEVKEEAKEEVKEDKENKEETKEEKVETVEEVQEKVEEIKEELVAEIGDLFSPIKDENTEYEIKEIFEDNGEQFVETEVEGKKKVFALKNVTLKKKAQVPAKPTTAPSAGMKWVFDKNTNSWKQMPENTNTVEVEATNSYKYTLIKSGENPRWLIIDKNTNKIAHKLYLKDLPKEASSFGYKQVIAKTIAEQGLSKVASLLTKKAIKVDDTYTMTSEDGSTSSLKVKSISINDMTKETFINVQIGDATDSDNIFSLSKFMKMIEDGQLVKNGEEIKEVVEEAVNNVEQTEDAAPMKEDETTEPMNDLQSSTKEKLTKKAEEEGDLVPQAEPINEENLAPTVAPTDANVLANGEEAQPQPEEVATPKEEIAELVGDLTKAVIEMEEDKVDFVKQEVQDAIDYINGKSIEEIEKAEEEILEFSDITWEDEENKELPETASVDVDDINFNNINAEKQGAKILASIYKSQPKSFKVVAKKFNKMNKTAAKISKVSFIQIMEDLVKKAQDEVKAIHLTAQLKEKKANCDIIVKEAINKGLVQIDSAEIKKNILKGMSQIEAREMAVRKAADEQVKNLMAMDEVSINAYKDTVSNFVLQNVKQDKGISRIIASADYDEEMSIEIPWSRHK